VAKRLESGGMEYDKREAKLFQGRFNKGWTFTAVNFKIVKAAIKTKNVSEFYLQIKILQLQRPQLQNLQLFNNCDKIYSFNLSLNHKSS
jgi:hypothetical protein